MTDETIDVGAMLYTLIEPHRGHQVAYNRWYERDHFYAGVMTGQWTLAGRRWVSLAKHKAMRLHDGPTFANDISQGSFLSTYFAQQGKTKEWITWSTDQYNWLVEQGDRMFAERTHVHTEMYSRISTTERDDDGVPPHMALDHPFPGMITTCIEAPEPDTLREVVGRYEACVEGIQGRESAIALTLG